MLKFVLAQRWFSLFSEFDCGGEDECESYGLNNTQGPTCCAGLSSCDDARHLKSGDINTNIGNYTTNRYKL